MPLFYLEELIKKTKTQNTATLKEALHEFIGTAYIVQKIGVRRNTDVQRNA
jgi:hypothetical protein